MSLWTPSGEHPIERDRGGQQPDRYDDELLDDEAALIADARAAIEHMPAEERTVLLDTLAALGVEDPGSLSDDDLARHLLALNSLAASQQRLMEEPVASHVASHAVGLHQLASLHLSQPAPALDEARLAIDALAGLLDAAGDRLGDSTVPLRHALTQLQQAYVAASD